MSRNMIATSSSSKRLLLLTFFAATVQLTLWSPLHAEETKAAPEASAAVGSGASSSTIRTTQPEALAAPVVANLDDAPLHDSDKTMNPWKVREDQAVEYKKQIDESNKTLAKNPNDLDALATRADANLYIGTPQQVIDDAEKTLSIKSKEKLWASGAYCNRGEARLRLKEYKLALEDFNNSIETDPNGDIGESYFFRGMAQERLGMLELALKDYKKADDEGFVPVSARKEIDFSSYMEALSKKIKLCWHPPRGDQSKQITVTFDLNRKGMVSDLVITKSSAVPLADVAALRAVHDAEPFAEFPRGARKVVGIQFTFNYNVFSGRSQMTPEKAAAKAREYQVMYAAAVKSGDVKAQVAMLIGSGNLCLDQGKYDAALASYKRAQTLIAKIGNVISDRAVLLNRFAVVLEKQGKNAEAEAKFKESIALANQINKQVFHTELKPLYLDYAAFLYLNHRITEANKFYNYFNPRK